MSIATLSSTSSNGYQSNFQHSNTNNRMDVFTAPEKVLLSPEQKNTIQQSVDAKITEQVENIKSNYQSAKDLDLNRSYYQQQQKLIDIYMQTTSNGAETSTKNTTYTDNTSAVSKLTETYATLYALNKSIKFGFQQPPKIPADISTLPVDNMPDPTVPEVLPVTTSSVNSGRKQTELYNSLMMPSTTSYIHLSA